MSFSIVRPGDYLQIHPPWKSLTMAKKKHLVLFDAIYIRNRDRPSRDEMEVAELSCIPFEDTTETADGNYQHDKISNEV